MCLGTFPLHWSSAKQRKVKFATFGIILRNIGNSQSFFFYISISGIPSSLTKVNFCEFQNLISQIELNVVSATGE